MTDRRTFESSCLTNTPSRCGDHAGFEAAAAAMFAGIDAMGAPGKGATHATSASGGHDGLAATVPRLGPERRRGRGRVSGHATPQQFVGASDTKCSCWDAPKLHALLTDRRSRGRRQSSQSDSQHR